jgi:hypothetical protein
MELLDLLTTSQGINTLLIAFVPGFITLSLLDHWFNRIKLREVEMIFWSIPLSLLLASSYQISIFFIFGNFQKSLNEVGIFAFSGVVTSIMIFISMSIIKFLKLKNSSPKTSQLFIYFFVFMFMLGFFVVEPVALGAPYINFPTSIDEWLIIIKGVLISFFVSLFWVNSLLRTKGK